VSNDIRKVVEDFKNRFIFHNFDFIEAYEQGKICVVFNRGARNTGGLAQSAALRATNKTEIRRADHSQKLGAAIGAAGQELQPSAAKMPFVGGHDQR
jgi:hypothetical protein